MKAYVGFAQTDSDALKELGRRASAELPGVVRRFYDAVDGDPEARAVVEAHSRRERLEGTLLQWLVAFCAGPHDDDYYEKRCRIGRMHLRIRLKPHYVFMAMNILREGLTEQASAPERSAVNKLMDIELGIINQVYWDDVTAELQRTERMATIGELAGSFAHEVRNPLMAMQNSSYLLRHRLSVMEDPKVGRALTVLEDKIEVCSRLVGSMLEFARHNEPAKTDIELADMLARVVADIDPPQNVVVETHIDSTCQTVRGDEVQLGAVMRNLVRNAVQALEDGGGTITLRVTRTAGVVSIAVSDDGPGVPSELQTDIFRPLVTTKTYGMGLGLPYCKRVAAAHGGRLVLESEPGSGATFILEVPHS